MTIPDIPIQLLPHGESLGPPAKATEGAAAFDLRAAIGEEGLLLMPGRRLTIPCGFAMALPPGWEAQVRPRSGLAARHGVTVLNAPGTIDADYRGEVMVVLIHHGDTPYPIVRGERIAQLVVAPVPPVRLLPVETLPESDRGDRGFGSTGRT